MKPTTSPTNSRFYEPCLCVLEQNAPNPMGVAQIIDAVRQADSQQDFRSCNGGVRAILIKMAASDKSPIKIVDGTVPPLFYVEKTPSAKTETSVSHPKKSSKRKGSIFYEPACKILKENLSSQMTATQIMKIIVEQYPELEWCHSQGPIRSMLLSAAKMENGPIRQVENTLPPMFFYQESDKLGKDEEAPEQSPEEIMDEAFEKTQIALKESLQAKVLELDSLRFEHLANRLVAKMLFGDPEDTPASGDGGIDGFINIYADPLGLNTVGVQAKHYAAGENVQRPEIQQFVGALHGKNGVFVTCSDFSPKARQEAEHSTPSKIVLINGKLLVEYMIKYKVGVHETGISYTLSEVDDTFFEDLC